MLSAPLMVYRGAMLAWSLWLALACLRWSRWVWGCLREHGWWRPLRIRHVSPDAAAPPAAVPDDSGGSPPAPAG
jgi:hypothetical protein